MVRQQREMEATKDINDLDKRHLWISYRRGKMMICKGYGSSDRGIPRHGSVLAEVSGFMSFSVLQKLYSGE